MDPTRLEKPEDQINSDSFNEHSQFEIPHLLNVNACRNILDKPHNYSYIKKIALERLEVMICQQLNLFNLNHCYDEPDERLTTYKIFNWSLDEFLQRRNLQNFVWIDVMLKKPEICLHKYKFKIDLQELQKYIKIIFEGIFANKEDRKDDIKERVLEPLYKIKQVLEISENIEQEYFNNQKIFKEFTKKTNVLMIMKRSSQRRSTALLLQNKLINRHILDPIGIRYDINWHRTLVNQKQYRLEALEKNYENLIMENTNKTQLDMVCTNSCMDYYYSSIEQIKNSINDMQNKFDKATEELEYELSLKRIKIDKLSEQRKWLTEQIERFHIEIEEMRLRQEREEARERERLKLEEDELAAKMAKKKRRKKGKKIKAQGLSKFKK